MPGSRPPHQDTGTTDDQSPGGPCAFAPGLSPCALYDYSGTVASKQLPGILLHFLQALCEGNVRGSSLGLHLICKWISAVHLFQLIDSTKFDVHDLAGLNFTSRCRILSHYQPLTVRFEL